MNLNKVFLMGNLTRDPELKYTGAGTAICNITVAVNETYTSSTGEKKQEVIFAPVAIFGKIAENASKYLKKGSPVFVEGKLKQENWETQNGEKRQAIKIMAINVQFLGVRENRNKEDFGETQEQTQKPGKDNDNNIPF